MTAPADSLDARLDAAFGPSDPATDALIAASIVAHRLPARELTALPLAVVQYGGRWSVVTGHALESRSGGGR